MKQQSKLCAHCGKDFIPERRNGMYCSPTCRQYNYLKKKNGESPDERVKEIAMEKHHLQSVSALLIEEENSEASKKELAVTATNNNVVEEIIRESHSEKNKRDTDANKENQSPKLILKEIEKEKEALHYYFNRWQEVSNKSDKINFAVVNERIIKIVRQFLQYNNRNITNEQAKELLIDVRKLGKSIENRLLGFIPILLMIEEVTDVLNKVLVEMQLQNITSWPLELEILETEHFKLFLDCMEEFANNSLIEK